MPDTPPEDAPRVGIIASPDHEVFADVARRLEAGGVDVVFFEPGVPLPDEAIRGLAVLVNKKVRWPSFDALRRAEAMGVPTWNGHDVSLMLASRLAALTTLESAGFVVPPVTFDPPPGPYVSKAFFDVGSQPAVNAPGDFYQPLLPDVQYDQKYYAVDDGHRVHVACVLVSSKLDGRKVIYGRVEPDPTVARRLRWLVRALGVRSLGVDIVETDGRVVAVDCNIAPSFRGAGLEEALAASIRAAAGLPTSPVDPLPLVTDGT